MSSASPEPADPARPPRGAALRARLAEPPPGPARPSFWRSPLRSAWLTTMLGWCLLAGVTIVAVTGLISHAAYQPDLRPNALIPVDRDVPLPIGWPASPTWLYALTQGLHVTIGIVVVPLLLAKLWSVIPRLFAWPPAPTPAAALERLSVLALVGSALFQFATGIANVQLYYPFHFSFVAAHYYGACVFVAALVLHVAIKVPTMRRAYRTRRETLAPHDDLRAPDPDAPTLSRRGFAAMIAAASGGLLVMQAGQSLGGPLRDLALLAPRGRGAGFPVNKTAASSKVTSAMAGASWRLELVAVDGSKASLSREDLLGMPQRSYDLPIACVEGWTTTQRWTGVRLRDLAERAGVPEPTRVTVTSMQARGGFREVTLGRGHVRHEQSLLALAVNGAALPLDHGAPARIIAPNLPGVHCTKWVGKLEFV